MKNFIISTLKSYFIYSLLIICCSAQADSKVNFHGTLVVVTCQVNQDQTVNVSFGNVGVKKVDGVNFSQRIPFAVSCTNMGGEKSPGLTLSVTGNAASFDDAAVMTNVDGLAIRIMKEGEALKINTETEISYSPQPVLTAVPVKEEGMELMEGSFHASATLVVHIA